MRFPVAREGLPFIIVPLGLALGLIPWVWPLALLLAALGLFSLWFFRDPDRIPPPDPRAVVSPADGRVIKIDQGAPEPLTGENRLKISIFMSVVNVHVNRAPMDGRVEAVRYSPGKFLVASLDKASADNEQNAVMLEDNGVRVVFVQIAGLVARRIVCRIGEGQTVSRGQRIGMIRFGSRLDVYLPRSAEVMVTVGDVVRAGESALARLVREAAEEDSYGP
jgi:phosphatidylserine decarboxylase